MNGPAGLELRDGDAHPPAPDTEITGVGLQPLRWPRYEIESYLIHSTHSSRGSTALMTTSEWVATISWERCRAATERSSW